jgi:DamX protein
MAEPNSAAENPEPTTSRRSGNSAVHALLTLERAQKLDLLNHLIKNLQQSLVVCGPEGIGKTTLLKNLKANKQDSWIVYSINATAQLSFEQVQSGLEQYLQQSNPAFTGLKIDPISHAVEEDNQKIVFLIDDAGLLVPGLINSICQLAAAHSALRVVFALTADEVHLKNNSDRTIDECHFIEIPALTESQCGDFLKNLASKPDAIIPVRNLNSAMIGQLYRDTHGIPGNIVNIQKNQNTGSLLINWQWVSLAAAILLVVTVSFFLWDEEPDKQEKLQQQIAQNIPKQQAEKIVEKAELSPPVIEDIETKLPINPEVVSVNIEPPGVESSGNTAEVSEIIDVAKNETKAANSRDLKSSQHPKKQIALEPEYVDLTTDSIASINDEYINPFAREKQKVSVTETRNQTAKKGPIIDSEIQDQVVMTSPETTSINEEREIVPKTAEIDKNVANGTSDNEQKPVKANQKSLIKKAQIETTEKKLSRTVKQKAELLSEQELTNRIVNKSQAESKSLQGTKWVLDQNANHYSLQLMAISRQSKAELLKIIKKHNQLRDELHYFETVKNGEGKYILLYGSFSTSEKAEQAVKILPKEFGKPWLRSFKILHKQIKASSG